MPAIKNWFNYGVTILGWIVQIQNLLIDLGIMVVDPSLGSILDLVDQALTVRDMVAILIAWEKEEP